jgi:hypothetical protein
MFIFYNPQSLNIEHIVVYAPENYKEFLVQQGEQNWIEAETDIPVSEIALDANKNIIRRSDTNQTF